MTIPYRSKADRSRDEVLAGEYVLGALDQRARRNVKARMRRDAHFAAMVERWEDNLADYDQLLAEPCPTAVRAVRRDLPLTGGISQSVLTDTWNSIGFWRLATTAAIVGFSTFLAFYLFPEVVPRTRPLTAEMAGETKNLNLQAHYDHRTAMLHVVPVAAGQAADHSLQLWLLKGEEPPRSLGLLTPGEQSAVLVPTALRRALKDGVTFAVSVEPPGGAPGGHATGPMVAMGEAHF